MPTLNTKLVLTQIVEVHQRLRYITTVEEAMQILLPALTEGLGFQAAMLKVRDDDGLFRGYTRKPDGQVVQNRPSDLAEYEYFMQKAGRISNSYFASHEIDVWGSRENGSWEYVFEDPNWVPGKWHPEDALLVPVFDQNNELVGVLWPDMPLDGQIPDEKVVQVIEVFTSQAVAAIEIRRLLELTQQASVTDGLTMLHTHRHFQECLEQEVAESLRHHDVLSLLMLDLDHFKSINDRYGHPVGDEVLRQVAAALRATARESDSVARYGGEEFVVVLPRTDTVGAACQAERIREAISRRWTDTLPGVTVSVGVASFPADAQNKDALIMAADKALLRAKREGRNRVCLFDESRRAA